MHYVSFLKQFFFIYIYIIFWQHQEACGISLSRDGTLVPGLASGFLSKAPPVPVSYFLIIMLSFSFVIIWTNVNHNKIYKCQFSMIL